MFEAERGELLWVLLARPGIGKLKKVSARNSTVSSTILSLFILLLQSTHVSENFRGRLRLAQSGLGGLLRHMKSREQRGSESAFIDLVFKCDFSLTDKFSLINYLAGNETTHLNERLKIASSMCEWLVKCPEQTRLSTSIKGWQDTVVKLLLVTADGAVYDELIVKVVEMLFLISWKGSTTNQKAHKARWVERLGAWCCIQRLLPAEVATKVCQGLLQSWLAAAVSRQSLDTQESSLTLFLNRFGMSQKTWFSNT